MSGKKDNLEIMNSNDFEFQDLEYDFVEDKDLEAVVGGIKVASVYIE